MIRAAVIGHPISQSLSPRIYNTWFKKAGIEGTYEAFDVPPEYFDKFVRQLATDGYAGVNVTLPHKISALKLADEVSPTADAVGAANLLTFRNGLIHADNTDAYGFSHSVIEAGGSVTGQRAIVLGAGGAAAAVLFALRDYREVILLNRTRERAENLALGFKNVATEDWERRSELIGLGPELLVNTTSLGMSGQPALEIGLSDSVPETVIDIVYKPLYTDLLKRAKSAGAKTQHGLSMLVHQAVPSFEAYTGKTPAEPETLLSQLSREFA